MKRVGHLWASVVSEDNLMRAIEEVNRTHHWYKKHKINRCTLWVEQTKEERVRDLQRILEEGFVQAKPRHIRRYDPSAQKWRDIHEPRQWPDQYIHHALIQAIQPVLMRGMDPYCCGSIRGRGSDYARKSIKKWMKTDKKGTKYCFQCDIYHFYDSLTQRAVMNRMRQLIKDRRVLSLIEATIADGIFIGAYTSQWYANTVLQPLDHALRQDGYEVKHNARYMDNFTGFGSNKRKLHRAIEAIGRWLRKFGLRLKGDWQVFPIGKAKPGSKRHRFGRLPAAVGFRYERTYTIPRKRNYLRLKRAAKRYRDKVRREEFVSARIAAGLLSRIGQLAKCSNVHIYACVLKGERIQRDLKNIVRQMTKRKGYFTWNTFLEPKATSKSSRSRVLPEPA